MPDFSKTDIKVPSATRGWNLDVWQYLPKGPRPPVIVMGHGLACVKVMGFDRYAREFAGMGYGVLAFDYRSFGHSDGEPRTFLSINWQLQDFRTVISWARRSGSPFDGTRVVVFGFSLGGGHALRLATENLGLVGAVGIAPFINAVPSATKLSPISSGRVLLAALSDLYQRKIRGGPPVYVRAACEPGELGFLAIKGAPKDFAEAAGGSGAFVNQLSASCVWELGSYTPVFRPSTIRVPTLVVMGADDAYAPGTPATWVVNRAPLAESVVVPGDHFDFFDGSTQSFEPTLEAVCSFIKRVAPLSGP